MKVSIIVPTRNESNALPHLLKQLQPLRSAGHEVLVIDGGSLDGTLSHTPGFVDQVSTVEAGRANQLNAGARLAQGEVYWFLHVDSLVPEGAVEAIQQVLREPGVCWGWFDVRLSGEHPCFRVIEWAMNRRSRLTRIATGDQGLFVRRSAFEAIGGYPNIALMEDIEVSKALGTQYAGKALPLRLTTSSRRWEQRGILRTVLLMWLLRAAHFFGCDPQLLRRVYQ